jgi:hypothetical protein
MFLQGFFPEFFGVQGTGARCGVCNMDWPYVVDLAKGLAPGAPLEKGLAPNACFLIWTGSRRLFLSFGPAPSEVFPKGGTASANPFLNCHGDQQTENGGVQLGSKKSWRTQLCLHTSTVF